MDFVSWALALVSTYGYVGIFIATFINGIGFGLPTPVFPIIAGVSSVLNPFWVIFFATLASTLGEVVAFGVGILGYQTFFKEKKSFNKVKDRLHKHKRYLPLFAILPLPSSTLGISSGILKINLLFFLLSILFGRLIRMSMYVAIGYFGINILF
jgi:membrane protein YqaA with SNARE-associated domain